MKERIYRLLRWSEKYVKTDMVYVGKNGFWLMMNQVTGIITSFILSILFARYISKDTFGIYKYILSTAGFVSIFTLNGMNTAITRAVSQGFDGTFAHSLPIQAKWTLGQFIITVLIAAYYFINGNTVYGVAFLIIAICGPISTVTNSFSAYLQGKQDFKTSSRYSMYSSLIYFFVTAISIFTSHTLLLLVCAYYVSTTFANIYFCIRTLKRFPPSNTDYRSEDVIYAKKLSLMMVIGSAANQIDSILVYQLLGPEHLAVYAFSTLIPDRIRSSFSIITSVAFPRLSSKSDQKKDSIVRKQLQLIITACVIMSIYILIAPPFYNIFFPQYLEAVWYSQLYVLSLLMLPSFITLPSLYADRKEYALYVINIGLPLLKISVSFCAIVFFGILGAIIAKIIHYLLQAICSGYFALRESRRMSIVPKE